MQQIAVSRGPATRWSRRLALPVVAGPSLFDVLFPRAQTAHRLAAAVAFAGLVAVFAQARFFLPENPVPITLQTFGVLMTGTVLGWRWGVVSISSYYLAGMAGLPVFQGGGNGWRYITSVTGGYLVGFVLATYITGCLSQHGFNRGRALWAAAAGAIAVYVPALIWLSFFDLGWPKPGQLFSSAVYPFIPGDLIKMLAAGLATGLLWRLADWRSNRRGPQTNTPVR